MSETRDCGCAAGAYVLGALDPSEVKGFRRHLDSCVVCRDEVTAFGHVTDALAMAAPQQRVPRGLRRGVLREIRAEPSPAARTERRRRPFTFVPRVALAGGLFAAVALVILGGIELPGGSRGPRVIQASVTGSPGSAHLRVKGSRAELIVNHLPPPPAGRIYEVWVRRGSRAPSPTLALFNVTAAGAADVGVPGDVRGVSAIMVTQEPAGGSLIPTHPPVIVARLT